MPVEKRNSIEVQELRESDHNSNKHGQTFNSQPETQLVQLTEQKTDSKSHLAAIDIKALTTDKSDLNRDLKQDLISRHTDEGKISAKIRKEKSYQDEGNVMSKPGLSHRMPDS